MKRKTKVVDTVKLDPATGRPICSDCGEPGDSIWVGPGEHEGQEVDIRHGWCDGCQAAAEEATKLVKDMMARDAKRTGTDA